jgi:hypothetical protein
MPARVPKKIRTPPPALHVTLFSSISATPAPKSDFDVSRPAPTRPYGRIPKPFWPPKGIPMIRLPVAVNALLPPISVLP